MTLKQRIDQHDKEIAEIRALQKQSQLNITRIEKGLIDLVNQQAETNRGISRLERTVDTFVKSIQGQKNGRKGR